MPASTINIVSPGVLDVIGDKCAPQIIVSSLRELRRVLDTLPPREQPTSLDLIGHSTRDARLLRLGTTVVDMADVRVSQFFEQLAPTVNRLGVVAVRLLGCATAVEPAGQRTIRALARALGVSVYGARKPLANVHYADAGFDPAFAHALIESAQLPNPPRHLA